MSSRWIIVSDMDGTLLDHHDYRFDAVLPMLKKLKQADIPLILNTSKTFVEVEEWTEELELEYPFIVENGSAIYIPKHYFSSAQLSTYKVEPVNNSRYLLITTGSAIAPLKVFLQQQQPSAIDLTECSLAEAMRLTGLSREQALAAQHRQFSIPLLFSSLAEQDEFSRQALASGFGILQGGRFLHLLGDTDKGRATEVLRQIYQTDQDDDYRVIGLGDSPNDQAMLEQSDVAVIVQSPSSIKLKPSNHSIIRTLDSAPEGWVEGVQQALNQQSIHL